MSDGTLQVDHERVLRDVLDACLQHGNPPPPTAN